MDRDGSGVTALLGLDGFVVRARLLEETTGEWWLAVETTESRAWCPTCGLRATGHGRRRVMVRDLPIADRAVVLVWAKRVWRCPEPACATGTWSEESDEVAPRAVLTERARAEIARRVGPGQHSVAQTARDSEWAGTRRCTNLIIKNIKRLGFGFRNFENYRLRLLLRCGAPWQHRIVASIRPRHPRVSA